MNPCSLPHLRCAWRRAAAVVTSLVLFASAFAGGPFEIGSQRQVFIDGRWLRHVRDVHLQVMQPVKRGIVLQADDPVRSAIGEYGSVLEYHGRFYMYYDASTKGLGGYLCVAFSKDGLHWTKPKLALARPAPGAEPNIVVGCGAGGFAGNIGEPGNAFIDPNAPPNERFRIGVRDPVRNKKPGAFPLHLLSSPDGIHWRMSQRVLIDYHSPLPHLDSENVVFWDPAIRKYRAYVRYNLRLAGGRNRAIAYAASPDLQHFPQVEDMRIVLANDGLDPRIVSPKTGEEVRVADFYTNATIPYPWAQDAYYMFPSQYRHYGPEFRPFEAEQPRNAGVLDIRFAASRDGVHWCRYDRSAYVPLGMRGSWDAQRLYLYRGVLPGGADKLYLYYYGSDRNHGWGRDDRNRRLLAAAGLAPHHQASGAVARLELRRDGFVAARAAYAGGEFTTPPVRFTGGQLVVNIDTSATGTARIELQDQFGAPLPGFTLADADRIFSANEINHVVTWKGRSDVSALAGKPIRLRFVMNDTDLYAFQFTPAEPARR